MAIWIGIVATGVSGVMAQSTPKPKVVQTFKTAGTFGGYSGYFSMPSSTVITEGDMSFALAKSPAIARQDKKQRVAKTSDNYSALIGLLPSCEIGISLLTPAPFNGIIEDRSASFKFAPIRQEQFGFNLAVGNTDVHGTDRRVTRYVVAGRRFGNLNLDFGYMDGQMGGFAAGGHLQLDSRFGLMAEHCAGVTRGGVTGSFGRTTISAGYGSDESPVASVNYAFPLRNNQSTSIDPVSGLSESALAGKVAALGGGRAEAIVDESKLYVAYEDVEGRDPVATLGKVLRTCLGFESSVKRIRVVVRRLGNDVLTFESGMDVLRDFMSGDSDLQAFSEAADIADGSMGRLPGNPTKAGRLTTTLVTLRPFVKYQLGQKDRMPNAQYVEAKATTALPMKLLASVVANAAVRQQYTDEPFMENPSFSLTRAETLMPGLWATAGIERIVSEPWSASLQLTYVPKGLFRGSARYAKPLDGSDREAAYALEAGVEDPKGSYYGFARTERFRLGDEGRTLGLTRRFGQTWVTVQNVWSDNGFEKIKRVGVNFQIPLPAARVRAGNAVVTTAPVTSFGYLPRTVPRPSLGAGEVRPGAFTTEDDLTFRAQLTERYVRQHLEQLRG